MKKVSILFIALLSISLGFVSCSDGEDGLPGKPGLDGDPGQPGSNGEPGADGNDGNNAIGYDELTQYGSVTVNLEGTRPDNVPFESSVAFKYSNTQVIDGIDVANNVTSLYSARFLSTPDGAYQDVYLESLLTVDNLGEDNEVLGDLIFLITNLPVVGEDNKYFVLNVAFQQANPTDIIQNFAFDATNNHLTYSYSFSVNADNNTSGFDLNVSGEVDVYLLDKLN
ncbi:collagen-like protein [Allomuricauda sp. NBRC 101325]|uniref:collagen-like triple helix repeat-containing protein n=1 Tax=Allomuricauda sp. NBRC 101325 TaxID=1113758 RepID=UPI0024A3D372|nr:collagen-like protein [Muricauda sp. NBRC 101325]GLU42657.1 hypothetical protein Musp01_02810 [Muricauda sp. NBRC 101325]